MHLVSRPCPTDLLKRMFDDTLSFSSGAVVAGGAARLLWFNELAPLEKLTQNRVVTQSDIDVFVYPSHCEFLFMKDYIEQRYDRKPSSVGMPAPTYETVNAISYNNCKLDEKFYSIQLIKRHRRDLTDIFNCFDLVNCQFATDGRTIVATAQAVTAWQEHRLVMNGQYDNKAIKLDRMLKYLAMGLMPDRILWNHIMTKAVEARSVGMFPDGDYDF